MTGFDKIQDYSAFKELFKSAYHGFYNFLNIKTVGNYSNMKMTYE
jgi:hypothetical protein